MPVSYLPIAGVRGHRVGDDGSVWTCLFRVSRGVGQGSFFIETWGWRRRKLSPDKKGYLRVTVPLEGGGSVRAKVHHLVLAAFEGPKPEGQECRHLDNVKTNNARGNLCWGTPEENREDSKRISPRRTLQTRNAERKKRLG
jgi:hypothetical protein